MELAPGSQVESIILCGGEEAGKTHWSSEFLRDNFKEVNTAIASLIVPQASKQAEADTLGGLQLNSPTYAFPAVYPPQCSEDPFPCRYGNFSLCKARLGPQKRSEERKLQCHASHDVSSLIAAFEKLSIYGEEHDPSEDIENRNGTKALGCAESGIALTFTTRPLRAPLDSLVRNNSHRRQTIQGLARINSSSVLFSTTLQPSKGLCAEEHRQRSIDFQQSYSSQTEGSTEISGADTTLPSDSEDLLPSLSYSSSSSAVSDDGRSQSSPDFSFYERDFLSPLLPCVDSLPYSPLFSFDDTKL